MRERERELELVLFFFQKFSLSLLELLLCSPTIKASTPRPFFHFKKKKTLPAP